MAPTEERYREILERLADSSHRNDIQFGTEPNRYNGAQHAGLEFGMTESMPERSGRPEGLEFGESERGTNPTLGDRTGSATCPPRHDSEPVVFVTSTPELVVRQSKPLFDVVKETPGMSSIITSPDSAYVSRPVEADTTELASETGIYKTSSEEQSSVRKAERTTEPSEGNIEVPREHH